MADGALEIRYFGRSCFLIKKKDDTGTAGCGVTRKTAVIDKGTLKTIIIDRPLNNFCIYSLDSPLTGGTIVDIKLKIGE